MGAAGLKLNRRTEPYPSALALASVLSRETLDALACCADRESTCTYLLQPIIIPTWASALALARWGGSLAEPYQFRNAWPRRFEQGNIHH